MGDAAGQTQERPLRYPDLGAEVFVGSVSPGLADELPALYNSLFCTEAWFRIFDEIEATGACVLAEPRHVLLFSRDGDTIDVLNKAFVIAPEDAERACRALFRALPDTRRIHLEVQFPPTELSLPKRLLYSAEDMVIDLPATVDEYYASLGKRTRKNARSLENRLRRAHPDVTTTMEIVGERTAELAALFFTWHFARAQQLGIASVYSTKPEQVAQLTALIREMAEAHLTTIGGREVAIEFVFRVGSDATMYAGAFDGACADLDIGFLSTYWTIRELTRRGAHRCHLLWGTDYYKALLGARPETATRLSVFDSGTARLHSLEEAREVAWRNLKRRSQRDYWRVRHTGRRLLGPLRHDQGAPN